MQTSIEDFLACEEPKVRNSLVALLLRRAGNLETYESPLRHAPVEDAPYARPRAPLDATPTGSRAAELTSFGHSAHV